MKCLESPQEEKKYYTLETSDGVKVKVSQDFINQSEYLKENTMLEEAGVPVTEETLIPLPAGITSATLKKLIQLSENPEKLHGFDLKTLIELANAANPLLMEDYQENDEVKRKGILTLILEELSKYLSYEYLASLFQAKGLQEIGAMRYGFKL